jgi:hypothetical protein
MNPLSELLKEILVSTYRGAADQVAQRAGLAYRTVLDQTDGRINPSIEVIKAAWLVTSDPRLKLLLEPTGWELVQRAEAIHPVRDTEGETVDVVLAASRLIELIREAQADRKLTKAERIALLRSVQGLKRDVLEAEAALNLELASTVRPKLTPVG